MTALIDYNAGNVFSVMAAFRRLGEEAVLTDDAETILAADRVVFPGVGYASSAMQEIKKRGLEDIIRQVKKPFLGICLGVYLLLCHSYEGLAEMLSILPADVRLFD